MPTDWNSLLLNGCNQNIVKLPENNPFGSLNISYGEVNVVGGTPGVCKTLMGMTLASDFALANSSHALIANVDQPKTILLERDLSRFSGVSYDSIHSKNLSKQERLKLLKCKEQFDQNSKQLYFLSDSIRLSPESFKQVFEGE